MQAGEKGNRGCGRGQARAVEGDKEQTGTGEHAPPSYSRASVDRLPGQMPQGSAPRGVAMALQRQLGVYSKKSLSESHPVRGRSQPRTGNPRGVQPSTSLLSRKEPGWSRLRLRPWLQRCLATWGGNLCSGSGRPRATWVLAAQVLCGHAGLPAVPQTHQSAHRSQLLLLLCPGHM